MELLGQALLEVLNEGVGVPLVHPDLVNLLRRLVPDCQKRTVCHTRARAQILTPARLHALLLARNLNVTKLQTPN